jgi:phospholipid-binding lipoprotein MlaA
MRCFMHVQVRLVLLAVIASWILGIDFFIAPALSAEPLQDVVIEDGAPGIDDHTQDYDPWEPFNRKIFTLNYALDRYVLKPVATVYHSIVLPGEQEAIHNMFENVAMPKRFVNSLLQGKFQGAGRELARFLINTTLGVGGMADVAKYQFHIEESNEDGGKTLAHYGAGQGPYLILPFISPLTVRDAFGYLLSMDPINFFVPVVAIVGKATQYAVNERARTLQSESSEDVALDQYIAVRHEYLTRPDHPVELLFATVPSGRPGSRRP